MLQIYFEARCPFPQYLRSRVRRSLKAAIAELPKVTAKKLAVCDVSVSVVGPRAMQKLNRDYRKKDKVTDVLSFAAMETVMGGYTWSLGDIVICWARTKEQRRDFGTSVPEELERVLVHGFLHLLGYDHELNAYQARRMQALETRIAARLKS